ncbi:DUF5047 domain-containing protein [Streptomyces malaysiensis]
MQPVSSRWPDALASAHGLETTVRALYNGAVVDPDVTFDDGSVRVDRGSDTRRSLSLSIPDPANFPFDPTDTFGVYGQQLYVESGISYTDGTVETVPVGTFVITNVSGDIHTGPLSVSAAGLEILLKRSVVETATSTPGFLNAASFIAAKIAEAIPGSSFVDSSTNGTRALATATWDAGTDYWQILSEVATAVDAELYADANGTFRLVDIPNIDTATPVWDVAAGENGILVSAEMELTADDVYNRVVAMGENTADNVAPVRGTATITDPTDPLRYGGPFGKVTKVYSSSLVTNASNATSTANAILRKGRMPNRKVSISTVPNAALEAGDCFRAVYGSGIAPELHLAQSFELPLTAKSAAFNIETVSGKPEIT